MKLSATRPPSGGLMWTCQYSSFGACDGDGDDEFGRAAIEKIHGQDEGGPGTGLLTSDGGIEIPYISPRWL